MVCYWLIWLQNFVSGSNKTYIFFGFKYTTLVIKIAVTFEPIIQCWCSLKIRISEKIPIYNLQSTINQEGTDRQTHYQKNLLNLFKHNLWANQTVVIVFHWLLFTKYIIKSPHRRKNQIVRSSLSGGLWLTVRFSRLSHEHVKLF